MGKQIDVKAGILEHVAPRQLVSNRNVLSASESHLLSDPAAPLIKHVLILFAGCSATSVVVIAELA